MRTLQQGPGCHLSSDWQLYLPILKAYSSCYTLTTSAGVVT